MIASIGQFFSWILVAMTLFQKKKTTVMQNSKNALA
jgi:hypothetical protein